MPGLKRQTVSRWLNSLASEQDACTGTFLHSDSTFKWRLSHTELIRWSTVENVLGSPQDLRYFCFLRRKTETHTKRLCLKHIKHLFVFLAVVPHLDQVWAHHRNE